MLSRVQHGFDLVDLSKSEEEITQAIHHWLTFIENAILWQPY